MSRRDFARSESGGGRENPCTSPPPTRWARPRQQGASRSAPRGVETLRRAPLRGVSEMNVGLYFDLRTRRELGHDPARTYGFVLEACEEADRAGIHSAWFTEHHSFPDAYLPQPLTMAAAVAARTRRLRVGTSVVLAPLRSPVQIAEEAAVVD